MAQQTKRVRLVSKHDVEANWLKAINFIPLIGEIIVYDVDAEHAYERIKIGDGVTNINNLPFFDDHALSSTKVVHGNDATLLSTIIDTYILAIDYEKLLAFDTTEIVIGENANAGTSATLGFAILGQMILG